MAKAQAPYCIHFTLDHDTLPGFVPSCFRKQYQYVTMSEAVKLGSALKLSAQQAEDWLEYCAHRIFDAGYEECESDGGY